jgi:DNA mismatch endonuclease (patch repair protein)
LSLEGQAPTRRATSTTINSLSDSARNIGLHSKAFRRTDLKRQPYKRVETRLAGRARLTTDASTSGRMGRVRQSGTAPELLVRKACAQLGVRYTTKNHDLPGSPDLANRSRRWAIFVHGCYWHRHKRCSKATTPRTNTSFWLAKFARNVERDVNAKMALRRLGFRVLTVWQCEAERPRVLAALLNHFSFSEPSAKD